MPCLPRILAVIAVASFALACGGVEDGGGTLARGRGRTSGAGEDEGASGDGAGSGGAAAGGLPTIPGTGGGSSAGAGDAGAAASTAPYAAELQRCVDLTNEYRATLGRAPLARSAALETFAAKAATSDAASGRAHGYFSQTRGGGIAMAENAIPGWPMGKGVRSVVEEGLAAMWDEGPGGGHHDNMASTRYKELGCGIVVTAAKQVWVVQDFR